MKNEEVVKNEEVMNTEEEKVGIVGYLSLIFAVLFFSGLFSNAEGWLRIFDFQSFLGAFGAIGESGSNFLGSDGSGVRDGFMQALSMAPIMIFSVAFIGCIEYLGGLRAAQKLLTPVLKLIAGVPGITGLAMILNWQSSDASAGEARRLYTEKKITAKERERLVAYEFIAAATIGVFFSNGALLLPHLVTGTGAMLLLLIVMKFVAANLMRLYQYFFIKDEDETEEIEVTEAMETNQNEGN